MFWRVPSDTIKTPNVDFEKEEAHCIRYKRLFVSSISNSQYLCSVSQNVFSRWSHSAVLGLRTNTLIAKFNTEIQNAFENVCHEPIINDHSLQCVPVVRFCLLHIKNRGIFPALMLIHPVFTASYLLDSYNQHTLSE